MSTTTSTSSARDAFTFLPQGALIQRFQIGGHNLVQNFPSAESYLTKNTPYFGETIGRVANRISNARINSLNNGQSYSLTANNGPNTLHGGPRGWGKRIWEGPRDVKRDGREAVEFVYRSKHLEEGFPGTVEVKCWYFCERGEEQVAGGEKREVTSLEIEYEVELVGDEVEETAVSVTNHSYFNLSGNPTIDGTRATLPSNLHLPVDETDIPTGEISPYPDIPANEEFTFTATTPAPDHCFIVDANPSSIPLDTRTRPLRLLCSFSHPDTGLHLEALSTEPAFQLYDGKYVDVPAVEGSEARGARAGFCVEASRYVNAVNEEKWRGMVVLPKGKVWGSRTVYRGWKE